MSRRMAGVGSGGTRAVHRKAEPRRRGPWSRRSALVAGACQDGQRPTSVCSLQAVRSGAWTRISARWRTRAAGSTPAPRQVGDLAARGPGGSSGG
ncbi:hypothetical protein AMK15_29500 [Streptomyces sp. MJM1172]|nr:hypothetical protein AMK15_29500 [Streptomyces sp. MJM1172]